MKRTDLNGNYTVIGSLPPKRNKDTISEDKEEQGVKGLEGASVGFVKGALTTSRNVASGLQSVGQRVLGAIDPTRTYEDIRKTTGFKSIDNTTEEGKAVKDILTEKGKAEKVGKTIENIAEFFVPASKISKATAGSNALVRIGGQVASDVGVTAAQQGSAEGLGKTAILSATLSSLPLVGKLIKSKLVQPTAKAAEKLEEINLRLTPTQKQQLNKTQNQVIKFLARNKVTGTPAERLSKIDNLVDVFEDKVQTAIKSSGKQYSKTEIIDAIKTIPDEFLSEVDNPQVYNQMLRDTEQFIDFINKQKGDFIDAGRINAFKRSFAKNARNKAGDVILNESRDAISDGLYTILQRDIKELRPINKEYAQVLLSQKLLGKAVGRNELGLIGKIISMAGGSTVGGAVGGPVGAGVGIAVGPQVGKIVAGTQMRSRVGSGLQSLSEYLAKAKTTKAGDFIIPRSIINSLLNQQ